MATKVQNGLDLASVRINNVADPTSAQDGSTKNYTDNGDSSVKKFALAMTMIVGV